jgi:hypothetical protein
MSSRLFERFATNIMCVSESVREGDNQSPQLANLHRMFKCFGNKI